jgi:hypothetical protein
MPWIHRASILSKCGQYDWGFEDSKFLDLCFDQAGIYWLGLNNYRRSQVYEFRMTTTLILDRVMTKSAGINSIGLEISSQFPSSFAKKCIKPKLFYNRRDSMVGGSSRRLPSDAVRS